MGISLTQAAPYIAYQAIITQTGTSAPKETVYKNDLGVSMTWARTSAGLYTLTAGSAAFTANKTVVILSNPVTGLVQYTVVISQVPRPLPYLVSSNLLLRLFSDCDSHRCLNYKFISRSQGLLNFKI